MVKRMLNREEGIEVAKIIRDHSRAEAAKLLLCSRRTVIRWAQRLEAKGYDVPLQTASSGPGIQIEPFDPAEK